jgi:hypothetical protein
MVTATICAIPRNACKSLPISYAQQKLAQPMLRTQLILLGCFACPHQIPERLGSGRPVSILLPGLLIYECAPASRHPADFS